MILWMFSAFAQAPEVTIASKGVEVLYVASLGDPAKSKRFITDKELSGPVFAPASAVRVLFRENGLVRVRNGDDYGWVAEGLLSTDNPKPTEIKFGEGLQFPGAGD